MEMIVIGNTYDHRTRGQSPSGASMDWSREEVEAVVADYLHRLTLDLELDL